MKRQNAKPKGRRIAFTLIELLIVVAIIAILAAIAVPNFLEAQTRAKVSRSKTDQRSMAMAIEAYAVDWNRAPLGQAELKTNACLSGYAMYDSLEDYVINAAGQSKLTTPVAYITAILLDPFKASGPRRMNQPQDAHDPIRYFVYHGYFCNALTGIHKAPRGLGYTWLIQGTGPSLNTSGSPPQILAGTAPTSATTNSFAYDPTNGTVSSGFIIRSNKGIFTVRGS